MSKRKISNTERLEQVANAALAAGMTYGKYQQHIYAQENRLDKSNLKERQPIYEKELSRYICPKCAHPVVPRRNCEHCENHLLWKAGVKE